MRGELIDGAIRLLDAGVRDDELSLRAVAKEAGVAAPSIYRHFGSREDILLAVVDILFTELAERLVAARAGAQTPMARLRAMCVAYCTYAFENTAHYRALFARSWLSPPHLEVEDFPGLDTFAVLQDTVQECIDTGTMIDDDAFEPSVRIWAALHGVASLRLTMPRFPWPPLDRQIDAIVPPEM